MQFDRAAGVFLHVTALPGAQGIGTLGDPAHRFLDWLDRAGVSAWQFCPFGPTRAVHGHSPYQSPSAFAGNPLLVDHERLVEAGWLPADALDDRPAFDDGEVRFDEVVPYAETTLRTAFETFEAAADDEDRAAFEAFRDREAGWLDDYALFAALKERYDEAAWTDWPEDVRRRTPEALASAREDLGESVRYHAFVQFCFDRQWRALREAATERGVDLVGDVPIYVATDSADVWANPHAFRLDEDHQPAAVAGVPPQQGDEGQRWGNPLYDWEALADADYDWWVRRLTRLYDLVDVVRLDHFKGFESYWAIPADADHPSEGEWREGPGVDLFDAVEAELGAVRAIAEDLGHLTPDLHALREATDIPGMRVSVYADWCAEDHLYQPHTYPHDAVAYTSTHDTDTVVGWYADLGDEHRDCLHYYLDTDGHEVQWDLLDAVWDSDAGLTVTPLQDVLGLGSDARFNTPGTLDGNWAWRVTDGQLSDDAADRLHGLTEHHDRT